MEPIKRRVLSPAEVSLVLAEDDKLEKEAHAIKEDLERLAPSECMVFYPDERCTEDGLVFFLWNLHMTLPRGFSIMAHGKSEVYVYRAPDAPTRK